MSACVSEASPVAIKASGKQLLLWVAANDGEQLLQLECLSDEHAAELAVLAHRAFGIRTKENSFTTGLLHRDIEAICGL